MAQDRKFDAELTARAMETLTRVAALPGLWVSPTADSAASEVDEALRRVQGWCGGALGCGARARATVEYARSFVAAVHAALRLRHAVGGAGLESKEDGGGDVDMGAGGGAGPSGLLEALSAASIEAAAREADAAASALALRFCGAPPTSLAFAAALRAAAVLLRAACATVRSEVDGDGATPATATLAGRPGKGSRGSGGRRKRMVVSVTGFDAANSAAASAGLQLAVANALRECAEACSRARVEYPAWLPASDGCAGLWADERSDASGGARAHALLTAAAEAAVHVQFPTPLPPSSDAGVVLRLGAQQDAGAAPSLAPAHPLGSSFPRPVRGCGVRLDEAACRAELSSDGWLRVRCVGGVDGPLADLAAQLWVVVRRALAKPVPCCGLFLPTAPSRAVVWLRACRCRLAAVQRVPGHAHRAAHQAAPTRSWRCASQRHRLLASRPCKRAWT